MTYIARKTPADPTLHLSPTGDATAECDGTRLDRTTIPTRITAADTLCRDCFTPDVISYAAHTNNARSFIGTDGPRVDRLLRQALRHTRTAAPVGPARGTISRDPRNADWFNVDRLRAEIAWGRHLDPPTGATLSLTGW